MFTCQKNVQSTKSTRRGGVAPPCHKLGCFAQFNYMSEPIYASLDHLVTMKCQPNLANLLSRWGKLKSPLDL